MKRNKIQIFLRELVSDFRWSQWIAICCLMALSILFVYSATYRGGSEIPIYVKKQWTWFMMGTVCYFLVALVDYHWFCRISWPFYIGALGLLVFVSLYGHKAHGAQRWIDFYGFRVQPSEFAKLSMVLVLSYYLSRYAGRLNEWRHIGVVIALTVIPTILIKKQPDLGTALVIVALFLALIFLAGAPTRFFIWIGALALVVMLLAGYDTYRYSVFRTEQEVGNISPDKKFKSFTQIEEFQLDRILGMVAPEKLNPLKEGYNRKQSLIAIGSGGMNGKGWLKGDVTHGEYLPSLGARNDFIFAVFAEETGFTGGIILLGLYATLLLGGIKIAMKARDRLGMLLAAGATFLLFFHVFVNMGMTLGILPIVGIPLPLMSYGGSFVLVCMITLGLLQSVWLHRKPY